MHKLRLNYSNYFKLDYFLCILITGAWIAFIEVTRPIYHIYWLESLVYMVYRPCDLYESDSSPCDINHRKDYTAWTSYDKNNFLLLFIDILFLDRV
jgi:hypothetical protein